MSLLDELGRADLEAGLAAARREWPCWVGSDPELSGPEGMDDLRRWLRVANPDDANRVLLALVRRGSPWGGDEPAAVWVVVWALLPGAIALGRRLGRGFDQLLASQLWLEVRTFRWERRGKVAAGVLANSRSVVLRRGQLTRISRTQLRAVPEPPGSPIWERADEALPTSSAELVEVLEWACGMAVITSEDVALLMSLVEYAHGSESDRGIRLRSGQGLMRCAALSAAAEEWGVSAATVRRRVRHSIDALAAACRSGLYEAA
jgi:hypothetical protein